MTCTAAPALIGDACELHGQVLRCWPTCHHWQHAQRSFRRSSQFLPTRVREQARQHPSLPARQERRTWGRSGRPSGAYSQPTSCSARLLSAVSRDMDAGSGRVFLVTSPQGWWCALFGR
jgi:hypothetical protein